MATISENLNKVLQAKNNIKQAIIDKGVDMTDVTFENYSSKIAEIQGGGSGDGNASIIDGEQFITYVNWNKYNAYKQMLSYNGKTYPTYVQPRLVLIEEDSEEAKNKLVCETRDNKTYTCYRGFGTTVKSDVESYEPVTYTNILSRMLNNQSDIVKVLNIPSNIVNMSEMFNGCTALEIINLSYLNTSAVQDMSKMFLSCSSLTSLDLTNFNTSNVTDMMDMFYDCTSLTSLDLSSFNTSNVTNMYYMFRNCSSLTSLDLSSFDTSNVTNMYSMFYNCTSLTSLDLSNFDTSNVTNMQYMFMNCDSLNHIKCKQAFKDWCFANASTIQLPGAMQDGGTGTWEIVQDGTDTQSDEPTSKNI